MDNNLVIRNYNENDFDSLNILWQETGLGGTQRGDNEKIITESIILGGKLIVIENTQTHEIVGSSWMTFDGRRIHLHHIGVKPSYQNKGLGKKLTQESLKFAKEKGYQIKLEVHKDNLKAIKIYKNLGFNYLGDYDIYIVRDLTTINL
ncbi:MAG: hypothetical protein A2W99_12235 [Bacteroidetes bacterium GWF2_33_16]|nr:MAG: hypothetical protein A2X00_02040 [Bacteroidetes bacterium GWE2_32_14]OFY06463.1 MAG: hypothetical protein A2W99_12235 [Bacteroidetes bacterium GWF2_33_16]